MIGIRRCFDRRSSQLLLAAVALSLASMTALASASACKGKTTIFEDNFADASGGWGLGPNVRIENSSLVIDAPKTQNFKSLNVANTVSEADICADVLFPTATAGVAAGLIVWAPDYDNFYALQVQPNGYVSIWRYQHDKWFAVRANERDSSVKRGRDQVNDLRALATSDSLTFFVNGKTIQKINGKPPGSDWHFGVYGQFGKVEFKHFKVTTVDTNVATTLAPTSDAASGETYRALNLFGDVFERIRADYVIKPDDWRLIDHAIAGMMKASGAPPVDEKKVCAAELASHGTYAALNCQFLWS